jgi:predicted nuclease of restriction endonuclease-like (RecB) superfamily
LGPRVASRGAEQSSRWGARKFYETEALRCGWATRQLDRQINSQLYERIAFSRNKAALLRRAETPKPGDEIRPEEAIRDPFALESSI